MIFCKYRVIPGHRNWQRGTAVWKLAGFLHSGCALETRWQRLRQFRTDFLNDFLNDFLYETLNFLHHKNLNLLYENLIFSI